MKKAISQSGTGVLSNHLRDCFREEMNKQDSEYVSQIIVVAVTCNNGNHGIFANVGVLGRLQYRCVQLKPG